MQTLWGKEQMRVTNILAILHAVFSYLAKTNPVISTLLYLSIVKTPKWSHAKFYVR